MPKVQRLIGRLRSFRGKRCFASHCTGHKERTALLRRDLGGQWSEENNLPLNHFSSFSRFLSKQCLWAIEWLLVLILAWCVPGQSLLIELDHHLVCQDVISNHLKNKEVPGSTWHWPVWPAPGLPRRFPSTWSRTSTLQTSLLPQWFFPPAKVGKGQQLYMKGFYLETPVKTPRSDLFSWMSFFSGWLIFRVRPRTLSFLL